MSRTPDELPAHLARQLDGRSKRIVCSWAEWLDHSEDILAMQAFERVKLRDWPEIDLPDTRKEAALEIGKQYPSIVFEVPTEEEDAIQSGGVWYQYYKRTQRAGTARGKAKCESRK